MLQQLADDFARDDKIWFPGGVNECEKQALNLQRFLVDSDEFNRLRRPLWAIGITGGTGRLGFYRHNLVRLTPINGNPMAPMVIDAFHGPPLNINNTEAAVDTLANFQAEYPRRVDTPNFWWWAGASATSARAVFRRF
jgi:hypothetical protein